MTDVEAGIAAGCRSILVLTGRGQDQLAIVRQSRRTGLVVAADLSAAVESLLKGERDLPSSRRTGQVFRYERCAPDIGSWSLGRDGLRAS
jgi:hypothetical protein